jgi:hypothetical protein
MTYASTQAARDVFYNITQRLPIKVPYVTKIKREAITARNAGHYLHGTINQHAAYYEVHECIKHSVR